MALVNEINEMEYDAAGVCCTVYVLGWCTIRLSLMCAGRDLHIYIRSTESSFEVYYLEQQLVNRLIIIEVNMEK